VFKSCRDINEFDQTFSFDEFKEQSQDLEQVKLMFEKLAKWDATINKITNEQKRGLFTASGRKLREKLQSRIKKEQENLRQYLIEMATDTDRQITNGLTKMRDNLTKPITNLTSYVEFVNRLNQSKEQYDKLSDQKKKLEEMKAVLGKYRVKDENAYTNQSKISQLQSKIDQLGDELMAVKDIITEAEANA
jgi:DNA repair exonuclease SbcCD ATPase subunit